MLELKAFEFGVCFFNKKGSDEFEGSETAHVALFVLE